MNVADSPLRLSFPIPAAGEAIEVAPGVFWVRFPLPFKLDHVNVWLLRDGAGWTVVDTGINTVECRAAWETVFGGVLEGNPIRRVVVTHFHPDHAGLAGWLADRFDAPLWMPELEWRMGRRLGAPFSEAETRAFVDFYRRAGLPEKLDALIRARTGQYARGIVPLPDLAHALRDGETVRIGENDWRVLIGRGHAPEHASLYCPELGVLISGDQVLPEITPNISVWPTDPDGDPLSDFLETLPLFLSLPPETQVLPSHRWPFVGLHARVRELLHHHDARLVTTAEQCVTPRDAVTVLRALFNRALDDHQLFFAVGETLAHLHALMGRGEIERSVGPRGVHLFSLHGANAKT